MKVLAPTEGRTMLLIMLLRILAFGIISIVLTACGSGNSPASEIPKEEPELISREQLANTSYTLIDTSVRTALTDSLQNFQISLRDGVYEFPSSMNVLGYKGVTADLQNIVYGDVNGDDKLDAVIPIFIERKDESILEIAALTLSGSTVKHFASFPLGVARLHSLSITKGKIRVNFVHQVAGDPGQRNTELLLEIPKIAQ